VKNCGLTVKDFYIKKRAVIVGTSEPKSKIEDEIESENKLKWFL